MVRWRSPLKKEGPGDRKGGAVTGYSTEVVKVVQPKKASDDIPPPHFADDLIRRVIVAIDEWAAENGLSGLPRKVAFEQALAIMTVLYENSNDGKSNGR